MTSSDERKPKSRRRLLWLGALAVLLFGAYSAGWFWLAGRVKSEAESAVAALNAKGIEAACTNLRVSGYPLTFTVDCDNMGYQDDARNVAAAMGPVTAKTTVLWPLLAEATLTGPLRTSAPGMAPLWIDWDSLRGNAALSLSLPRRVSLTAEGLSGQTDPDDGDPVQLFSAAKAEAVLRPNGQDLDYVGRFSDLQIDADAIGGRKLPPLDGDGVATWKNGIALLAAKAMSLRGQAIEITSLDLSSGDAHVSVSGPISIDADGLIDARLMIRLQNPRAVAAILATAIPEQKNQIEQGFAALALLGSAPSMPLKIVKGKASLGFIPLGRIKPIE